MLSEGTYLLDCEGSPGCRDQTFNLNFRFLKSEDMNPAQGTRFAKKIQASKCLFTKVQREDTEHSEKHHLALQVLKILSYLME